MFGVQKQGGSIFYGERKSFHDAFLVAALNAQNTRHDTSYMIQGYFSRHSDSAYLVAAENAQNCNKNRATCTIAPFCDIPRCPFNGHIYSGETLQLVDKSEARARNAFPTADIGISGL